MAINRRMAVLLAISASVLLQGTVMAKDIYVRAGDDGEGTKAEPYGTVDEALRNAYAEDVVHVAAGDYFSAGGSGKFAINKPHITLVGGYNKDFSQRNPFKNLTRLMRGASSDPRDCANSPKCGEVLQRQKIKSTKSSYNPLGIIVGEKCDFAIVDGFVVDGYTRHAYKSNDDLSLKKGPIGTPCIQFSGGRGVKVRNSIVLNCGGPGIKVDGMGTKLGRKDKSEMGDDWSEISNTLIVNTLMQSINLRVGNMGMGAGNENRGAALLKNNTMLFNWAKGGEDYNLLVGRSTRLTVKNNLMGFSGYAINNGFGNNKVRLISNSIINGSHTAGVYKYWDKKQSNATVVVDNPKKLKGKKCSKNYACSKKSKGNKNIDLTLKNIDSAFFDKFMNQIASTGGGKVTMDSMNQWRRMMGLNLQGSKGSGVVNFAPMYDPGNDWEKITGLCGLVEDAGVQCNGIGGSFQTYKSTASAAVEKDYKEIEWGDIKRGKKMIGPISATGDKGMDITVSLTIGRQDMSSYVMPASSGVTRKAGWLCYRDKGSAVFVYVRKGTDAWEMIKESKDESVDVIISGTAYNVGMAGATKKIGIAVDSAESSSDD